LALAVVVQVVSSALVLAPLIGVGELARILLSVPVDPDRAWSVVLASTALLAAGFALRGAADLITHLADNAFALHVRRALATRLSAAPLGWFGVQTSGRIKQGMQDDVSGLHHFVAHSFTDLAAAVTTPVVVYAYLFLLDWRLALVVLAPVLIFVLIYRRMMAGSTPKMARYGQVLGELNSAVVEFVTGIPVVKTFGQAGRAHRAYREAVDRFTGFFLPWARPLIRPETISSAVLSPVTMILLALGGGTTLVAFGAMNPVDVVPFVVLGIGLSAPITNLASGAQALQLATGSAARVAAMLDIPRDAEPDRPQRPRGTTVEFDRVRFSYDGTHDVLNDVSAGIEPGTITAIVGESGSGKSTLARLLLRFDRPTGGAVRIGGVDVREMSTAQLMTLLSPVFQDTYLFSGTLMDNLRAARPDATEDEIIAHW
jgi:ATP-binding cassette subfamily B protein